MVSNKVKTLLETDLSDLLCKLTINDYHELYSNMIIPSITAVNFKSFNFPLWVAKMINIYRAESFELYKVLMLAIIISGKRSHIMNEYLSVPSEIIDIYELKDIFEEIIHELNSSDIKYNKKIFTDKEMDCYQGFIIYLERSIKFVDMILNDKTDYKAYLDCCLSTRYLYLLIRTLLTIIETSINSNKYDDMDKNVKLLEYLKNIYKLIEETPLKGEI